jgi:hypothetical protein
MNQFATIIRQAQLPTTASDRPKTYLHSANLVGEHSAAEHTKKKKLSDVGDDDSVFTIAGHRYITLESKSCAKRRERNR